jgi:molybdate transport system permease protein
MIGGNIPGKTRVASVAIYSEVEALHYSAAHVYSLILLAVSFAVVGAMQLVNRRTGETPV